jgi:acyl-CoA ligase (AMP-forming) (exosortase A-associated)
MPLAAARAGLVHVPINPLLKRAQVAHIVQDSEASLLVANAARRGTLEEEDVPGSCEILTEAGLWQAVDEAGSYLPPSGHDAEQLCAILYTSGSTGSPKGVMLSHRNLWLGAVSVAHYIGLAADDVTLAVLPLSFDYGQNQLLSTWYAGGAVVPLDYLVPKDLVKACGRHGVTTLAAVPPLWMQLVEAQWPAQSTAALRRITNSGGALTRPLVAAMRRTFSEANIVPMYGLTEAFRSSYLPPDLVAQHPTSIGIPIPFAELLIVNDAGEPAAAGEEGELVHCGPLVAQGYWRDAARTGERFRPAPPWSVHGGMAVYSGDRVRQDADGLLYFVGRRDAMIKSAGNRISPSEIEEVAMASGLVAEAVALGMADERLGQAVHLAVRAASEGSEEGREGLQQHLARELPTFMQPRAVHWLDALPRNPNGKFDRAALFAYLAIDEETKL